MKKTLAILLSVMLLASSLTYGIVMTSAASVEEPALFFDFTTKNNYDEAIAKTTISRIQKGQVSYAYDAQAGALRVDFKITETGLGQAVITCTDDAAAVAASSFTGTPVMAVKYRLSAAQSTGEVAAGGVRHRTYPYMGISSTDASLNGQVKRPHSYNATMNSTSSFVQTTNIDLSNWTDTAVTGGWNDIKWNATRMVFEAQAEVEYSIYIEWMGIFNSKADADAYANATAGNTTSLWFADFSKNTDYSAAGSANGYVKVVVNDATSTYENGALKVTGNGTSSPSLLIDDQHSPAKDGLNCFAMMVKLTNPSTKLTRMRFGQGGYWDVDKMTGYSATAGWQLVVQDTSAANTKTILENDTKTGWRYASINLANAGDASPIYIKFAGFFADATAAERYYNTIVRNLNSEIVAEGAKISAEGNDLRFGFRLDADGVNYAENTTTYARKDLAVAGNEAFVKVNGTWRQITDFGVMASIKQGITKSDLTVGAEAGSKVTQKVPAEKLYSAEGEVITFFATLMDIPESFFAKTVSAVAYVEYLDASGVKQYMYSDMLTKTVNDLK